MIGIYKITNKLNGKSYIGQSIHCGKRLDEHHKGNQFIDEVIQLDGVENFTFEILKECEKGELDYWEDYYIMQYDTFFPKGYNKRWNCSEDMRNNISKLLSQNNSQNNKNIFENKKEKEEEKEETKIKEIKNNNKITEKTSLVFTWLYGHASAKDQCVYKNFTLTEACKSLNISGHTWNTAVQNLKDLKWIQEDEFKYIIIKYDKNISPFFAYTILPKALELNGYLLLFYWELYEDFFISHFISKEVPFTLIKYIRLHYKSYKAKHYWIFREMLDYFQSYDLIKYEAKEDLRSGWNPKIIIKSMEKNTKKIVKKLSWDEIL